MNMQTIKENIVAISIAGVLTIIAVLIINNANFFRADIMLNQQGNSTETSNGDVSYTVSDGKLSVFANKDISNLSAVSLIVMFDKDKVKIGQENIDSKYDFTTADAGEGAMNVSFQNVSNFKLGDNLFDLRFEGDQKSVNIADVFVTFSNGEGESLSITKK